MTDKIRVGIIGANANYGWSKRAHLPALLGLPDFELTAVCTSRPETAEESKVFYGAKLAFHDYTEMANHPDVDLVVVSVSVPAHQGMVTAGLQAGKHVFCEWPLGANTTEAVELTALAHEKGVSTLIGLQARGGPALQRLRELVAAGYVGQMLACNMTMFLPGLLQRGADRAWMADRSKGANSLSIASGHALDIFCHCVGEFKELTAQVSVQQGQWTTSDGKAVAVDAPDNVVVSGMLQNGAAASAHIATIPWNGSGWRMEVYGTEGTLSAQSEEMVQYGNVKLYGAQGAGQSLKPLEVPDRLSAAPEAVPAGEPYNVAQLYRIIGDAIRNGGDPQPDFDTAVERHRFLDLLQQSSDEGRKVVLKT
jgi:predicted dehydrogenase